jgi:uncharacterized protein YjbI with pentapeptide repeats
MTRKRFVWIVCLLITITTLGTYAFTAAVPSANAYAAQQRKTRPLTIAEYTLLNQPKPLWLVGIDLSQTNLSGIRFQGANLTGANLALADIRYADLQGVNFSDADLTAASFLDCV